MGRSFLFECSKCGYRAKASGGADRGLHFAVQTIFCLECKELYDAVVEMKLPLPKWTSAKSGGRMRLVKFPARAPGFLTALNRLPPPSANGSAWARFEPACPISRRHRVREWNQPDRCPRCGVFLEANAVAFRIWE